MAGDSEEALVSAEGTDDTGLRSAEGPGENSALGLVSDAERAEFNCEGDVCRPSDNAEARRECWEQMGLGTAEEGSLRGEAGVEQGSKGYGDGLDTGVRPE